MEDLFTLSPKAQEIPEFSVSEISFEIKRFVETAFAKVRVKGEIFGAKRADSGHWYLSLKDENATLSAVVWRGVASNLTIKPEDGLEVVATGKITTFAGKSSYQMVIESMEVAGAGALLKLLEERKKAFAAEGLFDPIHKKPLPFLPKTIGVVTSASGAVIRDIIHRVRDRFPSHILLVPTPVQGEGAAEKIAQAIKDFNRLDEISNYSKPDVLIVARGGGSLEDLWPFNEECVIRAVFASQIPIISAVGHETDTMLIDYVADKRAPTPTGAAEFAVPVKSELQSNLNNLDARLKNGIIRYFTEKQNMLTGLARGIPNLSQILQEATQKFDDRIERLHNAFTNFIKTKSGQIEICGLKPFYIKNIVEKKSEFLNNLSLRLSAVSVDAVLKRGFAWVKGDKGQTIYNVAEAKQADNLEIRFVDGHLNTRNISNTMLSNTKQPKKGNKNNEKQISLFDL
ncbi:MAG: exodeoxyribonuclease VII large subunit [Alphaproteobacteria bacterium]|nr:exodeoxyribonuclease VII large subunit [Alphaproteobacteria bacterium]